MPIKNVDQISVTGRRVFVRVDFNVPLDKKTGAILDDTRIREALPTIQYLLSQNAKIILASHLGRPKKRDESQSLEKVAQRLSELLDREVIFPEDCVGDAVKKLAHDLHEGSILLLENLRFHPEEEANDEPFAKSLAQLAEVYVNDAFGTLHRAHASTAGMVKFFKEKAMGLLVKKEVECLAALTKRPERPYFAVLGGAKVSDKIGLIENLISKVNGLFLGGGLAYTFLKANGQEVGKSKVEEDKLHVAHRIFQKAKDANVPVYLPSDHRVADEFSEAARPRTTVIIAPDEMGLDIGPETEAHYARKIASAKTIFWNGPMGVFEWPSFAQGTNAIAKVISETQAFSVVGGGESVAAVKRAGLESRITHLSTGGGATLEYLEGKELPGLKALDSL